MNTWKNYYYYTSPVSQGFLPSTSLRTDEADMNTDAIRTLAYADFTSTVTYNMICVNHYVHHFGNWMCIGASA